MAGAGSGVGRVGSSIIGEIIINIRINSLSYFQECRTNPNPDPLRTSANPQIIVSPRPTHPWATPTDISPLHLKNQKT
jgi:hypothetical protein